MSFIPFFFADEKDSPANAPSKSRVPWPVAVACCLYYLIAYRVLAQVAPIFAKLHEGLGVALPLPTRLLLASYSWVFPLFFLGAVSLTIAKQFVPLNKLRLRIANLILIFVGVVFPSLVIFVFYLPLFVLIWKLHFVR
jgi:hypothetical protein